ncbi:MAG: lasso RiPP family leader peptide-containing protein [Cyanobacteria bacterium P01_G01_bin.39]
MNNTSTSKIKEIYEAPEVSELGNVRVLTLANSGSLVVGSDGDETLEGGSGNDTIFAEGGDDTITGGSGDDELLAGSGDDIVSAGSGNDAIFAEGGDDTITGGSGNDTITGVIDSNTLTGGSGSDHFVVGMNDIITDFNPNEDTAVDANGNPVEIGDDGKPIFEPF